jgi:hypothetical protein
MDGKLLREVYHRLFPSPASVVGRRRTFSDAVVALIGFFAAMTNHSMWWAWHKDNWPLWARRLAFPSYSQLMRRARSDAVARVVAAVGAAARAALARSDEKAVDGKPLVVGGYTKDPDARRGKVPGGWARGYKVHALADAASGAVDAFAVTPLNAGESTVARGLLDDAAAAADAPGGGGGGLAWTTVRGDANYDANPLYARAADLGAVLVAPRKKPGTGLGHGTEHHRDRLRAIELLEGAPPGTPAPAAPAPAAGAAAAAARPPVTPALAEHRRLRNRVEQGFAHLTNVPFGLWALPNHVRRLARVRRWVAAKVALYHVYLAMTRRPADAATG